MNQAARDLQRTWAGAYSVYHFLALPCRRMSVHCDSDAIVLTADFAHQFRRMGLGLG